MNFWCLNCGAVYYDSEYLYECPKCGAKNKGDEE